MSALELSRKFIKSALLLGKGYVWSGSEFSLRNVALLIFFSSTIFLVEAFLVSLIYLWATKGEKNHKCTFQNAFSSRRNVNNFF